MIEIQALVAEAQEAGGQKMSTGLDGMRCRQILIILSKFLRLSFARADVIINAIGGIRVTDPAADLSVAMAVLASKYNRAIPPDMAVLGEIGLMGACPIPLPAGPFAFI